MGSEAVGDVEPAADEGSYMRIGKRCFISNLSFKTSWQDLKDKFREVGNVVYANVTRDENGKSRGWGIVEYETPEEAVAAVNAFNGEEMAGRKILVREDREDRDVKQYNKENGIERPNTRRPKRGGRGGGGGGGGAPRAGRDGNGHSEAHQPSGLQVVVQGIPWAHTDEALAALFQDVGTVEQASVVYSKDGRSRGYGTVRFSSKEEAEKAIEDFNGTELEGRALAVKIDKFV
ncbi:hypothetical protein CVIRNUC_007476 [Coccomyxa viridis]|uniref:RRM domain-containing protein n=1 Tax=Coccomyxa viridis TaxID=1274662 RepID=A0AAV1IDJ0_9CHLO|nr:hypothetical protein CVIRNUC_007476 [Coccomyxa viridis]